MSTSGRNFFYKNVQITDIAFPSTPQIKLPFMASKVIISNDSDLQVDFSFLKPNLDGELFCEDGPITFDCLGEGRLWFKSPGTAGVRVWAWRGGTGA